MIYELLFIILFIQVNIIDFSFYYNLLTVLFRLLLENLKFEINFHKSNLPFFQNY